MKLEHDIGHSIELSDGSRRLWRYVYSGKPKPYFHPLSSPSGHVLTNFEPSDHVWHRGLWFTFKFVNGENFWEENDPYGTQRTLAPPTTWTGPGDRIAIASKLTWERPNGAGTIFRESRTFTHVPIGVDAYALDFDTTLIPWFNVLLDRTPFTTWGGYGGLIIRGSRSWLDARHLLADGSTNPRPTGVPAIWCDLSGKLDGGKDLSAGVAMFDHPANPRHPTPWYGATGPGLYLSSAPLFHEPMPLKKGDALRLRYRVLVHDRMWEKDRLQQAYDAWLGEGEQS
jgi:hypothetical protein